MLLKARPPRDHDIIVFYLKIIWHEVENPAIVRTNMHTHRQRHMP
jgi:hypothetical protein